MRKLTVAETASRLGIGQEAVRRGILEGKLPGTAVRGAAERTQFIIPARAVELFEQTGITPMMLAQSVCCAETIQQGVAIIRAALVDEGEATS